MPKPTIYITNSFAQNVGDVALLISTTKSIKQKMPDARVIVESTHPSTIANLKDIKDLELYPRILDIEQVGIANKWGILFRGGMDISGFFLCALLQRLGLKAASFVVIRPSRREQAKAFAETTILLSAAGGYLNTRHPHYLMRLYMYMLGLAWGKKVILFTQSIGPFDTKPSRVLIPAVLNKVHAIAVREPTSLEYLQQFNIKAPITLTSDIVFMLTSEGEIDEAVSEAQKNIVAFCVKLTKNPSRRGEYKRAIVAAAKHLVAKKYDVVFVSHTLEDDKLCEDLARAAGVRAEKFQTDVFHFKRIYQRCSFIIASRMHCIILASEFSVPFIALGYEPKFEGLAKQLDYPGRFMIKEDEVKEANLLAAIDELIKEREDIKASLKPKFKGLQEQANRNLDWLIKVTAVGDNKV